jgi:hypothetical protein
MTALESSLLKVCFCSGRQPTLIRRPNDQTASSGLLLLRQWMTARFMERPDFMLLAEKQLKAEGDFFGLEMEISHTFGTLEIQILS